MTIHFCIPGRIWTDGFGLSMLALSDYLDKHKIRGRVFSQTSADLYMNRNISICPQDPATYGLYPPAFKDYKPYNGKLQPDRIFWIDTDMVFTPEQVMRLVEDDVDMVTGLCPKSMNEWALGYYFTLPDGMKVLSCLRAYAQDPDTGLFVNSFADWVKANGETVGGRTLCKIDYCGSAFLCVKPTVYERMEFPYYRTTTFEWGLPVMASEDVGFCWRAVEAGTKIYADPEVDIGHQKAVEMRIPHA
jgi:hypothetical protein